MRPRMPSERLLPLTHIKRAPCRRCISTTRPRPANEPHTYFRLNSEAVYFPEGSRFGPQGHNYSSPPSRSSPGSGSGGAGGGRGSRSSQWSIFFAGFLAWPLLRSLQYAGTWAFGTEANTSGSDANSGGPQSALRRHVEEMSARQDLKQAQDQKKATLPQEEEDDEEAREVQKKVLSLLIGVVERWLGGESGPSDKLQVQNITSARLKDEPLRFGDGSLIGKEHIKLVRLVDGNDMTIALALFLWDDDDDDSPRGRPPPAESPRIEETFRGWLMAQGSVLMTAEKKRGRDKEIKMSLFMISSSGVAISALDDETRASWENFKKTTGPNLVEEA